MSTAIGNVELANTTITANSAAQRRRLRFGDLLKKQQNAIDTNDGGSRVVDNNAEEEMFTSPAAPPLRRSIVFDIHQNLNTNSTKQQQQAALDASAENTRENKSVQDRTQIIRVKKNHHCTDHHPISTIEPSILQRHKRKDHRPAIQFVCIGSPGKVSTTEESHIPNNDNHHNNNLSPLTTTTMELLQEEETEVVTADWEQKIIQETKHEVLESLTSIWSLECIQQCDDPVELQEKIQILEQPENRTVLPGLLRAAKERLLQIQTNNNPVHRHYKPQWLRIIPNNNNNNNHKTPMQKQQHETLQTSVVFTPDTSTTPNSHCGGGSKYEKQTQQQKQQHQEQPQTPMHISATSSSLDMSLSYSETENNEDGIYNDNNHVNGISQWKKVSTDKVFAPSPRKEATALVRYLVAQIERLTHTIVEMKATEEDLKRQLDELRSVNAIHKNEIALLTTAKQDLQNLENERTLLIRSLQKLAEQNNTADWRVLMNTLQQRKSADASKLEELTRQVVISERQLQTIRSELESTQRQRRVYSQQAQQETSNLRNQIETLKCEKEEYIQREQVSQNRIRRLQQLVAATQNTVATMEHYRSLLQQPQITSISDVTALPALRPNTTTSLNAKNNHYTSSTTTMPSPKRTYLERPPEQRPKTPAPYRCRVQAKLNENMASPLPNLKRNSAGGKENDRSVQQPIKSNSSPNLPQTTPEAGTKNKNSSSANRRASAVRAVGGRMSLYQSLQQSRRSPRLATSATLKKLNIRPVLR